MTRRLSGRALLRDGERALEPLLETAPVEDPRQGSVTALSRSRWSANAASSEAATCAASTAAVSSRLGIDVRRLTA